MAGGLGEAFINLTYGDYPRWLPVAAVSVILFVTALLVLMFVFRKDRHAFENRLALWLSKIWVELKLLFMVLVLGVTFTLDMSTTLGGMLSPVAAVIFLYFLCLDIGKNRQFFRHNIVHSLLKALNSYRDMTTFAQRSIRRLFSTLAVIIGVLGVSAVLFLSLVRTPVSPIRDFFLLGIVGFAAAGVIGCIFWYTLAMKRDLRDWSILMAQIQEMYSGNLNAVNHVPPTSNLYDSAMQLNMIRIGIQKAVEEGIKADRTKVELITNVSHDIKTPLTSIISYVELLKREPDLPPHVMDYIKTISKKADRLNHIVQMCSRFPRPPPATSPWIWRTWTSANSYSRPLGNGGNPERLHPDLASGYSRHAVSCSRRRPAAVPGISKSDPQLRPVCPGRLSGLCELGRPAQPRGRDLCHRDHSEHLPQRDHHGRRASDCPVCTGRPEPHHRGQRSGAVHCQELYRSLRRPVSCPHGRGPVHRVRAVPAGH